MGSESLSFEDKKPVDKYIENAARANEDFLMALDSAQSLEQIKQIVGEFSFIDEAGEPFVFEIMDNGDNDIDAVTFSEEELLNALVLLQTDPTVTEGEIDEIIPHAPIAKAVKRILFQKSE